VKGEGSDASADKSSGGAGQDAEKGDHRAYDCVFEGLSTSSTGDFFLRVQGLSVLGDGVCRYRLAGA
jgi:hypothetical protein